MNSPIAGVLPIAHTPFRSDESIDESGLARQIDWAFEQGADGFATGMVSELTRLTAEERIRLTHQLVEWNRGRGAVIMSVGAESTHAARGFARAAETAGCQAIMAIPPTTARLSADELKAYYTCLAEDVELPLIVQDASAYVGQEIPLDVSLELLDQFGPEKILFKPEAAPIGSRLSELRDTSGGKARVFEGSGGMLLIDSFRRGIAGTMPGMEVLDGIVALWRALQQGDERRAYELYFPICALVALQMQAGLDGFLAVEKHLLVRRGIFASPRRRRPCGWQLDAETAAEVDRLFDHLHDRLAAKRPPPAHT